MFLSVWGIVMFKSISVDFILWAGTQGIAMLHSSVNLFPVKGPATWCQEDLIFPGGIEFALHSCLQKYNSLNAFLLPSEKSLGMCKAVYFAPFRSWCFWDPCRHEQRAGCESGEFFYWASVFFLISYMLWDTIVTSQP